MAGCMPFFAPRCPDNCRGSARCFCVLIGEDLLSDSSVPPHRSPLYARIGIGSPLWFVFFGGFFWLAVMASCVWVAGDPSYICCDYGPLCSWLPDSFRLMKLGEPEMAFFLWGRTCPAAWHPSRGAYPFFLLFDVLLLFMVFCRETFSSEEISCASSNPSVCFAYFFMLVRECMVSLVGLHTIICG